MVTHLTKHPSSHDHHDVRKVDSTLRRLYIFLFLILLVMITMSLLTLKGYDLINLSELNMQRFII